MKHDEEQPMLHENNVEIVHPKDGKLEDKLVLTICILVVVIAAGLLKIFYSGHNEVNAIAPPKIRQYLTSLSNAAEELSLLVEVEGKIPSLQSIIALGIEPFVNGSLPTSDTLVWHQYNNCFLVHIDGSQESVAYLRLMLFKNTAEPYSLYWLSTETPLSLDSTHCASENGWQKTNIHKLFNEGEGQHAH